DGRYGWHWYLIDFPVGTDGCRACDCRIGWGGQRLHIVPSLDLAVVMSAGNYQQPGREQARIASTVMSEVVRPKSSPRRMRLCIGWQACTPRSICWLP